MLIFKWSDFFFVEKVNNSLGQMAPNKINFFFLKKKNFIFWRIRLLWNAHELHASRIFVIS